MKVTLDKSVCKMEERKNQSFQVLAVHQILLFCCIQQNLALKILIVHSEITGKWNANRF